MTRTVLIVVTHLLGSGHLSRALTLARAFAEQGHSVHLATGGFPAPQLDSEGIILHQLPPLRSDGTDFSRLLDDGDRPATSAYHAQRQKLLLDLLSETKPDLLITELFPFGRRNLKEEFLRLLSNVAPETRVACSIRDILAPPSKHSKVEFALETTLQYYDIVLVHSDPNITALEKSWPVAKELANQLRYTGFVGPSTEPRMGLQQRKGIVVSAGGGAVGDALFAASMKAAKNDHREWRLLVAGSNLEKRITNFQRFAPDNVIVERVRPDYIELLTKAEVSINMCGYNTAIDIIRTGVPSVVIPFDEGGEVEQRLRAEALSRFSGINCLPLSDLTPEALIDALQDVTAQPTREVRDIRFDGAQETVRICMELFDK